MPGLDKSVLDTIDGSIVIRRVQLDVRSDFILAPHYNSIFVNAGDELWARVQELLRSGKYQPELPLTINVPKGRGFTRPGSILHPIDRVVYQSLADLAAPNLEAQLDRSRSFGHVLADVTSVDQLFESSQESWENLQQKLSEMSEQGEYFVKADVANYFERIPQHHLINLIRSSGCQPEVVKLLEEMLLAFQERDSFGIIQGVFPSDVFGNFYLSDFDGFCELHDIPSARYVDDFYLQFGTEKDARRGLMHLIDRLRRNGLHLNEHKSGIRTAEELISEETEIDRLFEEARSEVEDELSHTNSGYGFTAEWDLDELDESVDKDLDIAAVIYLYEAIDIYPNQIDKIEKFCLPLLRIAGSDVAIERSVQGVLDRPHLTRLYLAYLSRFTSIREDLVRRLEDIISSDDIVSDYQRMYLIGALLNCRNPDRRTINNALQILGNGKVAQEARAIAAIFAAKFGNPQQRRTVKVAYESEPSSYVRAALLYASKYFTPVEHKTCIKAWGGHNMINALITQAFKSK